MIVDPTRLIQPSFDLSEHFPEFQWRSGFDIDVPVEGIIFADPIYVADVYNSDDPVATYLRLNALFIVDFGGDATGSIWYSDPFVVMPISAHYRETPFVPNDDSPIVEDTGCDSGSFMMLPICDIPPETAAAIQPSLDIGDAHVLRIPAGNWSLRFEQFPPPQSNMVELCRNIVLQRNRSG
jgi:hypothetical protein